MNSGQGLGEIIERQSSLRATMEVVESHDLWADTDHKEVCEYHITK